MKKAINLLIVYLVFLLAGILIGTFLYSCYLNLLDFVAGRDIKFFENRDLYRAVFYIAYCLVFFICPLIAYYRIRHPGGIPQSIAYILICLITWLLLFPVLYELNKLCDRHFSPETAKITLSKGYFRQLDNRIYYFTEDFSPNQEGQLEANTVVIDTNEYGDVYFNQLIDVDLELLKAAYPYKEILIKETFTEKILELPYNMKTLVEHQKQAWDDGFLTYLGFLSIALVICSLYGITSFFEWKLINVSMLFISYFMILVVNSVYYMPYLTELKNRLVANVVISKLGNYINDPLICVINLLFTVIFVVAGIIKFALHKHANKAK